ncbi:MAG: hypothetical protein NT133_16235 [Alphaproteobacteria bacterium]|nr:hypothetical protein [Alphaproteobacteria bacterium]
MTRPPHHLPDANHGFAALFGGILRVLLAALLGVAAVRKRDDEYAGVMAGALRAARDAEVAMPCAEEWVAVPAPWRAGRLQPWARFPISRAARPDVARRRRALVRAPPLPFVPPGGWRTGIAQAMRGGFRAPTFLRW